MFSTSRTSVLFYLWEKYALFLTTKVRCVAHVLLFIMDFVQSFVYTFALKHSFGDSEISDY